MDKSIIIYQLKSHLSRNPFFIGNDESRHMNQQILIVDDDDAIRDSISEYLTIHNFDTYTAAGSNEAVNLISNINFDVVITDIMMNGMDGLQLTEHIKAGHDTSVIIITGYTREYTYETAIKKGADDFVFKPFRLEELLLRLKRVIRERKTTQQRNQVLEEFKILSITDHLTGLYNSRHFYDKLQMEMIRHGRYNRPLSLLMIDIDHFKRYNDIHGHLEGDRALAKMGEALKTALRAPDTAYRYGGEEFTVLLPETDLEAAVAAAERIKNIVEKALAEIGPVTLSIGVTKNKSGETVETCMKRVDNALYMSKNKGRNCITAIGPSINQ